MTEEVCHEAMANLANCVAVSGGDDAKCAEFMSKLTECCAANNSTTGACEVNAGA